MPSRERLRELARELRTSGDISRLFVDGVELEYWRAGSSQRSIVFLHGNTAAKEVFYRQFEAFASSGFGLIAIDLPGHGGSQNAADPARQYTIPAYARIVNELLQQLNIHDYLLVGWSLGGNIALEMAGQGFDLAAALIMGAPPAGPGPEHLETAFLPAPAAEVTGLRNPSDQQLEAFVQAIYGACEPLPELFLQAARRTDGRARESMLVHWLSGVDGCDQRRTAEHWRKPLCVVHGREEAFVSLPYLQSVDWRKLWKGQIQLIDHSGHAPFLENPESFNSVLAEFAADVF